MPYVQAWDNKEVTVITMKSPYKFEKLPIGKSIATTAIDAMQKYQNQGCKGTDNFPFRKLFEGKISEKVKEFPKSLQKE